MTLPSKSQKLTENELESIKIAVKDVGLTAIHPEKMEAFAEKMVENLKVEHQHPGGLAALLKIKQ